MSDEPKIGHANVYGEPWRIEDTYVARDFEGTEHMFRSPSIDDDRRIVACVNALAGISDPEQFMADVREVLEHYAHYGYPDFYAENLAALKRAAEALVKSSANRSGLSE